MLVPQRLFLSHSFTALQKSIPLQLQRRGKYRCSEIANFFSRIPKREVIKQDDDMRSSRLSALSLLGRASSGPAYACWVHFVPRILDARISNTAVVALNMPSHLALESMTFEYRFAYSASETTYLIFFLPGARHVSRRGNTTGTKPQRSTALAGIWQVSFGAIQKANARWISGLGHSWYLKSSARWWLIFYGEPLSV